MNGNEPTKEEMQKQIDKYTKIINDPLLGEDEIIKAQFELADIYYYANDFHLAIKEYTSILEQLTLENDCRAMVLFKRGAAYGGQKLYAEAISDFSTILNMQKLDSFRLVEAKNGRAIVCSALGEYEKANADFDELKKMSDITEQQKADVLFDQAALSYAKDNRHKDAFENYSEILQMNKISPISKSKAYFNRAIYYYRQFSVNQNNIDNAIKDYKEIIKTEKAPSDFKVRAFCNLIYIISKQQDYIKEQINSGISADLYSAFEVYPTWTDFKEAYYCDPIKFFWYRPLLEKEFTGQISDFLSVISDLVQIYVIVQELLKNHFVVPENEKSGNITHFTKTSVLRESILAIYEPEEDNKKKPRSLWLYNTMYVNDPLEGQYLVEHDRKLDDPTKKNILSRFFRPEGGCEKCNTKPSLLHTQVYIVCYTKDSDSLPHWRTYGNDGDGVGIAIPMSTFKGKVEDILPVNIAFGRSDISSDIIDKNKKVTTNSQETVLSVDKMCLCRVRYNLTEKEMLQLKEDETMKRDATYTDYFEIILNALNPTLTRLYETNLRVPSFDIFATGVSEARQTLKLPFIGLPE